MVIAVAVVIMALTSRFYIGLIFDRYAEGYRGVLSEQWETLLTSYYLQQGSWEGVEYVFVQRGRRGMAQFPGRETGGIRGIPPGEGLILTDEKGMVVLDLQNERTGEILPQNFLEKGTPLYLDGQVIGRLIILPETARAVLTLEEQFSRSVALAIFWGSLGALLVGAVLGLLITGQVTRPLTLLTESAKKYARRDFRRRVKLRRNDEIGELAKSFNLMADSIERNETLRSNLVADVSHELRTPLTVLRGNLEALQDGKIRPSPELLSSLYDEVLRLGRLAHDLEAINLAEAGKLPLNYREVDVTALLKRASAVFQNEAGERKIQFDVNIENNVEKCLMDEDRIMQVLINLLANAFKFTPDCGKITLQAASEDNKLVIKLHDSGPGIDEKDLPFIFERFYKARKGRGDGTGLGLSIAKSFVEAHGGKIEAVNIPRGGSTFIFNLPRCFKSNAEAK